MNKTLDALIEAAKVEATKIVTITRGDGSTFHGPRNYGSADNGTVQVYVVPVTARTVRKQEHYRATFYIMRDGSWKRSTRAAADAVLVAETPDEVTRVRKFAELVARMQTEEEAGGYVCEDAIMTLSELIVSARETLTIHP